MKMNQMQRQKLNAKSIRVFKASVIMAILAAIILLTFACMAMQNDNALQAGKIDFLQYTIPEDDATVVVFETTAGTMKAVLFEKQAPEFCEYFKGLVEDGYYNNTYYFFVEDEQKAYAFGGAKSKDGSDTDDTDKTNLEPETSSDLWPFRGALCTYGREKGIINKRYTTGSRIIFVNSVEFDEELTEQMKEIDTNEQLVEYFLTRGGVPNYSQQFTLFGQIYEGLDVLNSIMSAEVNEDNIPKEDIKIISATLSTYGDNRAKNEKDVFPESFKQEETTESGAQQTQASGQ